MCFTCRAVFWGLKGPGLNSQSHGKEREEGGGERREGKRKGREGREAEQMGEREKKQRKKISRFLKW